MALIDDRKAIRHLLDESSPADAAASYYAFHHPDDKIQITPWPQEVTRAQAYLCLARTGIDLFRPLATMRFPESTVSSGIDVEAAQETITLAIPEGAEVIMAAPAAYRSLIAALFDVTVESRLKLLVLDLGRFRPVINVFVSRTQSYNGLPRFVIRQGADGRTGARGDVVASAGINWQSDLFAEIYVHTKTPHRRRGFGQSVVAACVQHLLEKGLKPLYVVASDNQSSIQLAESLGFVAIGVDKILIEGRRKALPSLQRKPEIDPNS